MLLMTKVGGHLPRIPYRQFMLLSSSPPSPPVVVVVDAVVVAQARRHTAHTHTRTRTRSNSRTPTHTHHTRCVTRRHTRTHVHSHTHPRRKHQIFKIHVANGSSALLPFQRAPGGLAVRRFGIASAPAGVPGTHSWKSLGIRHLRPRRCPAWRGHPSQAPPCSVAPTSRRPRQQSRTPQPQHHEVFCVKLLLVVCCCW